MANVKIQIGDHVTFRRGDRLHSVEVRSVKDLGDFINIFDGATSYTIAKGDLVAIAPRSLDKVPPAALQRPTRVRGLCID